MVIKNILNAGNEENDKNRMLLRLVFGLLIKMKRFNELLTNIKIKS